MFIGIVCGSVILILNLRDMLKGKKERALKAEKYLVFERKKQYSIFFATNLRQATNDLYFRVNEPKFNSDDLVYILNKNGLYLVDVDTFDQAYKYEEI